MNFIIGLLLATFCLFILSIQIGRFNELSTDNFRFQYFALRDRLAILVFKGKISEDSWEYQHIVDSLNFHIKTVETMTIWRIVSTLSAYYTSPELNKGSAGKRIDNEDVTRLLWDFLDVTRKLLIRNSRCQMKIVKFVADNSNSASINVASEVAKPSRAIDEIENRMHDLRNADVLCVA